MGTVELEIDRTSATSCSFSPDAYFALRERRIRLLAFSASLAGVGPRGVCATSGSSATSLGDPVRCHEHRPTCRMCVLRADGRAEHVDQSRNAPATRMLISGLPREFLSAGGRNVARATRQAGSDHRRSGESRCLRPRIVAGDFCDWSAYMQGDGGGETNGPDDAFPSLRIRREVALIGLSIARPSAPFLATGRLGDRQLQRLDRMLAQIAVSGLFRVVMRHHPPAAPRCAAQVALDGAALRDVLARHGVELVLHGHAHFSPRPTSMRHVATSRSACPPRRRSERRSTGTRPTTCIASPAPVPVGDCASRCARSRSIAAVSFPRTVDGCAWPWRPLRPDGRRGRSPDRERSAVPRKPGVQDGRGAREGEGGASMNSRNQSSSMSSVQIRST